MADAPERIACPTCGAENLPSAKTCSECGSDLTVVVGVISTATRHYNTALRLAEEGMADHAIIEAEAAVELWDKNAHFHNLLGTLYARKGLLDKAVSEWKKTLSLDPTMEKASDSIEKARKLEVLRAGRASLRPYHIALGVLGLLVVVLLAWGGYSSHRAGRLATEVTLLGQEREALESLRATHAATVGELDRARGIIDASGEANRELRTRLDAHAAELERVSDALRVAESQLADRMDQVTALQQRVAELERKAAGPPLISAEDLKALRDGNAALKTRLAAMETSLGDKDRALSEAGSRLKEMTTALEEQAVRLQATERELAGALESLAAAETRAASLEERVSVLRTDIRRWDLRNAQLAHVIRMAHDKRYGEAVARLDEIRQTFGVSPLIETLAAGIREEVRIAQDPFEQELRWRFEQERREDEARLREEFAARHLSAAERLFREGKYTGALAELETAEAILPGMRGVEEVRRNITGEQQKSESRVSALVGQADAALAAGDRKQAARLLEDGLRQFPEHPALTDRLAAVRQMETEVEPKGRSPEEVYREEIAEAKVLLRAGRLAEAVRVLDVLAEEYPEDAEVARLRADAERQVQERIKRIPGDVRRAEDLFIERRYGEVVALTDDVLTWDPGNRRALMLRDVAAERADLIQAAFTIAEELYGEGRYEEAKEAVDRILQAQPQHAGAKRLSTAIAAALKGR